MNDYEKYFGTPELVSRMFIAPPYRGTERCYVSCEHYEGEPCEYIGCFDSQADVLEWLESEVKDGR